MYLVLGTLLLASILINLMLLGVITLITPEIRHVIDPASHSHSQLYFMMTIIIVTLVSLTGNIKLRQVCIGIMLLLCFKESCSDIIRDTITDTDFIRITGNLGVCYTVVIGYVLLLDWNIDYVIDNGDTIKEKKVFLV